MERQAINNAIIDYLRQYRPERIGLFGSFARHEERRDSDIDILVKFKETISLLELVRIHRELSALLGKRVDLITEQALKNKRIKKYIYDDLFYIENIL
jgi:predicted nucleotidyltransferase